MFCSFMILYEVVSMFVTFTCACRVTEVTAGDFCLMVKKTRETERSTYGICVWSTGISPRPISTTLMKRFGQGERLVIQSSTFYVQSSDFVGGIKLDT